MTARIGRPARQSEAPDAKPIPARSQTSARNSVPDRGVARRDDAIVVNGPAVTEAQMRLDQVARGFVLPSGHHRKIGPRFISATNPVNREERRFIERERRRQTNRREP